MATGNYDANICPDDGDIFKVNLATNQTLDLTLSFTNANGDLDLYVYNPDGTVADSSEGTTDLEEIAFTAPAAGAYYIVVIAYEQTAQNTYRLGVTLGAPPTDSCQDDAFEQNDDITTARATGAGTLSAKVCTGDADFYKVDLNVGDRIALTMTYTQSAGDLDLQLVSATGTVLGESVASTGTETVSYTAVASGAHYVRVFGRGTAIGSYDLQVGITPATGGCTDDGLEQNDSIQTASPVAAGTVRAVICGGDDDFFAINANTGETLSITLTPATTTPNLDVVVLGPDGATLATGSNPGGDTVQVPITASGRHVVRVYGAEAVTTAAAYDLTLAISGGGGCTDDAFEENDTSQTARTLASGNHNAMICSGDTDYFGVALGTGDRLTATIDFDGGAADLDLYVYGPDGTLVDSSTGVAGTESVVATAAAAGTYVVKVLGYGPDEGAYEIQVAIDRATPTCHEDAFEENDTQATARVVNAGAYDAQICSNDDDFFGIVLNQGDVLTATATFAGAAGDLDVILYTPDGLALDVGDGTGDTETVDTTATTAGTYAVQIVGYNGAENAYHLVINVERATPTCTDDAFEENDSQSAARLMAAGSFNGKICAGDDDYYKIVLNAQDTLKVDVTFTHASGDLDLRVYNSAGTQVASSTTITGTESITYQAPAAGTYVFRVYGFQGAQNTYAMAVQVDPYVPACVDDASEENDSQAGARTVTPGALSNLRICRGDDDYYAVSVSTGDTLAVQLSTSTAGQNLDLHVLDGSGAVVASGTTTSGNETASVVATATGTLVIRVFGATGSGNAEYSLNVTRTPPAPTCTDDSMEQNDTLATASNVTAQTYQNLKICAADEDFFGVDVPSGATVTFTINFTDANGDLDMALLDANGAVLSSSAGTTDTESVSTTVTDASRVTARVYGFRAAENSYSLTVAITGGTPTCTDDAMEENDTAAAATTASAGSRSGKICSGDSDFFKLTLATGDTLTADLLFTHANGDLDLRLTNASGAFVASSASVDDNEQIIHTVTIGGTYYLEVRGYNGASNSYALQIAVATPVTCSDDGQEQNDSSSAARTLPTAGAALKICAADDDWFTTDLIAGQTLTASIAFTHASGDLDLRMFDSDGTTLLAASVSTTDNESVSYQAAVGKTVYVRVSGVSGAENAYTLNWQKQIATFTCPTDDGFEPNDTRLESEPLHRDQPIVAQVCPNDVDWYFVGVEKGDVLAIDLTPNSGTGDIDLYLHDWAGDTSTNLARSILSGAQAEHISYTATTPGTYFVRVLGYSGSQNRYALSLTVTPAAGACQEDTREDNDTLAQSRTFSGSHLGLRDTVPGQVCSGDDDWYDMYVYGDEDFIVDLKYDHDLGDLDIHVFDDDSVQKASSVGVSGTEHIQFSPASSGFYYVRVRGYQGAFAPYTLITEARVR